MEDSIKPQIQTTKRLLELRTMLEIVVQVSWSFSVLNKQYPIHTLTEDQAQELISTYEEMVEKVKNIK